MRTDRHLLHSLLAAMIVALIACISGAADQSASRSGASPQMLGKTVESGVNFLVRGQGADGSFSPQAGTGVTALVASALLRSGRTADDPADAQGVKHDWRRELAEELARRQKPDGSWINEADRWMEGDPNLVTSYVLLALSHCRPKK